MRLPGCRGILAFTFSVLRLIPTPIFSSFLQTIVASYCILSQAYPVSANLQMLLSSAQKEGTRSVATDGAECAHDRLHIPNGPAVQEGRSLHDGKKEPSNREAGVP